ncbi:hypothetical protein [Epilithonimonas sp.]|uniref:hypothetical protein n=1 Tax=Epilithonimonas sp. TaxID=2894511 RepID=UPI0035B3FA62
MKLRISIILAAIILLFSCRGDDNDYQVIDQVLNLYVRNQYGQDLLDSKLEGSYSSVTLLDLLSETALTSVSGSSLQKDVKNITYLDYAGGATRLLKDSISAEQKTYYSRFVIRYSKTVDTQVINDDDTIEIEYKWTPSLFELSKLWYNNELKFTKVSGQPNIVTIVK